MESKSHPNPIRPAAPSTRPSADALDEYEEAFGEKPEQTLNVDTWVAGEDLAALYSSLEQEVREAVAEEESRRDVIREELYPALSRFKHAAPDAGVHGPFSVDMIERAHRGILFNGAVEAADGTMVTHDTLPVTITQIGVYLVSYNGEAGSYAHRLYRRDLRARSGDPVKEVMELIERRHLRGSTDNDDGKDSYNSKLYMRGLMAWAERIFLLDKSKARWRMGHGNPTPYELLTGAWAHKPEMVSIALDTMRRLVEHKRFVYVTSAPSDRVALTLGHALGPMEYLVLDTNEIFLESMLEGHYRGDKRQAVEVFAREIGPQVVRGLYRVSTESPPYLFYAHRDMVHEAALIAMADGALQLHRGFPMLIDLADRLCGATFRADDFLSSVRLAYGQAGAPHRYLGERETRK